MSLIRNASIVSAMIFLSRLTGLAREMLLASFLGAGAAADAFRIGFLAPNMLRRIFAEGAFAQAFVPVLSSQQSELEARRLIADVSGVLIVAVLAVSVAGVFGAGSIAFALAPAFGDVPGKLELTASLVQFMFPYLALISLVSLMCAVLNSSGRYIVASSVPILLNASMIAAVLSAGVVSIAPAWWMAISVISGGALQLAIALAAVARVGWLIWPRWNPRGAGVLEVGRLMSPSLMSAAAAHFSLILNTRIAAQMGDGAVSWLNYADRLMEFPVAMLGVALATAIAPVLARKALVQDVEEYTLALQCGLRIALFLSVPASMFMIVAAYPLLCTLLTRGAFGVADAAESAKALSAYGAGLIALVVLKILAPACLAKRKARLPMIAALTSIIFVQLANLLLVPLMGHAGLALSIGFGAWVNVAVLTIGLARADALRPRLSDLVFLSRICVGAFAVYWLVKFMVAEMGDAWLFDGWRRWAALFGLIGASGLTYLATVGIVGLRSSHMRAAEIA